LKFKYYETKKMALWDRENGSINTRLHYSFRRNLKGIKNAAQRGVCEGDTVSALAAET